MKKSTINKTWLNSCLFIFYYEVRHCKIMRTHFTKRSNFDTKINV